MGPVENARMGEVVRPEAIEGDVAKALAHSVTGQKNWPVILPIS